MILSNNLENEFIDFVSGLLDKHLCNTDKSFFRYRQDVNGSINALRKSITDSYTASVLDKLLDCNLKMVRHQTMCALIRGVTFGIDYRRSYVPEDGRIGDLSGYRNLIYVEDYADLHEEAASLYMPLTQHQLHGLSAPPLPFTQHHWRIYDIISTACRNV